VAGDEEARARAILVEMQVRLSQGAHVALGIGEASTPEQVRAAFLGLTKQFHPARFGRMSSELQKMSNEVFLGIKSAHDSLVRTGGRGIRSSSGGVPTVTDAAGSAGIRSSQQIRATGQIPPLRPPMPTASPGTQPPGRAITPSTQPPGRPITPAPGTQPPRPGTPVPPGTQPGVMPARAQTPSGRLPSSQQPPVRTTPPHGMAVPRTQTPSRPPLNRPATPPQRAQTPPQDPASQRYPTPQAPQPQPQRTAPAFDERAALNEALTLLNRRDWTNARLALHALAARMPQERQYRALLCYARGREAFAAGRPDDAVMEFQRALQLDPQLTQASQALAELKRR